MHAALVVVPQQPVQTGGLPEHVEGPGPAASLAEASDDAFLAGLTKDLPSDARIFPREATSTLCQNLQAGRRFSGCASRLTWCACGFEHSCCSHTASGISSPGAHKHRGHVPPLCKQGSGRAAAAPAGGAVLGPRSEAIKLGFDAYLKNYQAVTKPVTRAMARKNSGEQIRKTPCFQGVRLCEEGDSNPHGC